MVNHVTILTFHICQVTFASHFVFLVAFCTVQFCEKSEAYKYNYDSQTGEEGLEKTALKRSLRKMYISALEDGKRA